MKPHWTLGREMSEVVLTMTNKTFGVAGVTAAAGKLIGIVTDGDLRRALGRGVDINTDRAADIMTAPDSHGCVPVQDYRPMRGQALCR